MRISRAARGHYRGYAYAASPTGYAVSALPVMVLACAATLWLLWYHLQFAGLQGPDAFDAAQLARNIATGSGFVTWVVRPLAAVPGHLAYTQPELLRAPLYPLVLATVFRFVGATAAAAAYVSGAGYVATILLVWLAARQVGDHWVAVASAALVALNPALVRASVTGSPLPFETALVSLLLLGAALLGNESEPQALRLGPSAGLLCCAAAAAGLYLSDWVLLVLVPAAMAAGSSARGMSRAETLWFTALAAPFVVPALLRNGLLTGNPLFAARSVEFLAASGGVADPIYATSGASLAGPEAVRTLAILVGSHVARAVKALPGLCTSWIAIFSAMWLLCAPSTRGARSVFRVSTLLLLGYFVAVFLFGPASTDAVLMAPVLTLAGVLAIRRVCEIRAVRFGAGAIALAVVATAAPLVAFGARDAQAPHDSIAASGLQLPGTTLQAVMSDDPWSAAWNLDRPAVLLPYDPDLMQRMVEAENVRWLVVTPGVRDRSDEWRQVYDAAAAWNIAALRGAAGGLPQMDAMELDGTGLELSRGLLGFATSAAGACGDGSVVVAHRP